MAYIDTYYRRSLGPPSAAAPCRASSRPGQRGGRWPGRPHGVLRPLAVGQDVVLLEGERIGWGASGRNGGFVSPGFATGSDAIARRAGPDAAVALHRLSIEGVRLHPRQDRELGTRGGQSGPRAS